MPCSADLLFNEKQGTCNAVDSHLAQAEICHFERAGKRNWSSNIFVVFILSCHEDILGNSLIGIFPNYISKAIKIGLFDPLKKLILLKKELKHHLVK